MGIRQLPKVNFAGTDFFLDLRLNEFRQVDNFMNSISIDELTEDGDTYALVYDTKIKNVPPIIVLNILGNLYDAGKPFPKRYKIVTIPSLLTIDPVGMANMYGNF